MINRYLSLPLLVAFFAVIESSAWAQFAGGDGSSGNPYQVATCSQLESVGSALSYSFILTGNIDCTGSSSFKSGAGFDPIGAVSVASYFTGTFDGNLFYYQWTHY